MFMLAIIVCFVFIDFYVDFMYKWHLLRKTCHLYVAYIMLSVPADLQSAGIEYQDL